MNFEELNQFRTDVRALSNKYRTLKEDLAILKKILAIFPDERPPFSISLSPRTALVKTIKVSQIACKSLRGLGSHSGLQLIYAWSEGEKKIVLVGLYGGSRQEHKTEQRILQRL